MIQVNVHARREDRWWVVEVDDLGVTQAKTTADVVPMARDYVAAVTGCPAGDVYVMKVSYSP